MKRAYDNISLYASGEGMNFLLAPAVLLRYHGIHTCTFMLFLLQYISQKASHVQGVGDPTPSQSPQ